MVKLDRPAVVEEVKRRLDAARWLVQMRSE